MPERANGATAVLTPDEARGSSRPAPRSLPIPRLTGWARLTLLAFCVAELALFGYARTASGLAHLHAVQGVSEPAPSVVMSACGEVEAAFSDFWPAPPLLNIGNVVPVPRVRGWGQVPRLADAVSEACPAFSIYAGIAPWPARSIEQGAAADLLADMRGERQRLVLAGERLARASALLNSIDLEAVAAEPRLERAARLLTAIRTQQADVSDVLALAASPDRVETLLGGHGSRAFVLHTADTGADTQAYAVLDSGRVVALDRGQAPVQPMAIVSVDHAGLANLVDAVGAENVPRGAPDDAVVRAIVAEIVHMPLSDDMRVASAIKHSAEDHHAWLWFEDPALQSLAARRGWVRQ
jgi:hypothetical protein